MTAIDIDRRFGPGTDRRFFTVMAIVVSLVVAAGFARVPTRVMLVTCLIIGLVSVVLLAPLYYLWFELLGWIG